jgi:hypothetical protein
MERLGVHVRRNAYVKGLECGQPKDNSSNLHFPLSENSHFIVIVIDAKPQAEIGCYASADVLLISPIFTDVGVSRNG